MPIITIDNSATGKPRQYFQRRINEHAKCNQHTSGHTVGFPRDDSDPVRLQVNLTGKYKITGVGTYQCADAYADVDVLLQVKTNTGKMSHIEVVASGEYFSKKATGSISCEMILDAGEIVELNYGDRQHVQNAAGGFFFGFFGDSLLLEQL